MHPKRGSRKPRLASFRREMNLEADLSLRRTLDRGERRACDRAWNRRRQRMNLERISGCRLDASRRDLWASEEPSRSWQRRSRSLATSMPTISTAAESLAGRGCGNVSRGDPIRGGQVSLPCWSKPRRLEESVWRQIRNEYLAGIERGSRCACHARKTMGVRSSRNCWTASANTFSDTHGASSHGSSGSCRGSIVWVARRDWWRRRQFSGRPVRRRNRRLKNYVSRIPAKSARNRYRSPEQCAGAPHVHLGIGERLFAASKVAAAAHPTSSALMKSRPRSAFCQLPHHGSILLRNSSAVAFSSVLGATSTRSPASTASASASYVTPFTPYSERWRIPLAQTDSVVVRWRAPANAQSDSLRARGSAQPSFFQPRRFRGCSVGLNLPPLHPGPLPCHARAPVSSAFPSSDWRRSPVV